MIRIKEDIQNITEKELEWAIPHIPAWRKAQIDRFKFLQGKVECAFSYVLLCEMLESMGIDGHPTFDYAPNGKPSLREHPDVHFNISHCKVAIACAVSDHPIGIDIEAIGRYSESLASYCMNAEELREINDSENRDIAFTRLWTKKEATAKLTGEGIGTNVRNLLADTYNIIYKTTVNTEKGYVVTVAEYAQP